MHDDTKHPVPPQQRPDAAEVDAMRQQYRAIVAPAGLASRIQAQVMEHSGGKPVWHYALAAAVLVLCIVWALPVSEDEPVAMVAAKPPLPSLLSIGRMMPAKPGTMVPSTTRIKSFKRPALPAASQFSTRNKT